MTQNFMFKHSKGVKSGIIDGGRRFGALPREGMIQY